MGTGLVYSPKFLDHITGPGHPESPERLEAIISKLEIRLLDKLQRIETGHPVSEPVELVHEAEYIERVRDSSQRGDPIIDSVDNPISRASYDVALLAVDGTIKAVDAIFSGGVTNAFVLPRPPGHHAEVNQAMGFCLFNNVAIAARYAQKKYDVNRVMIIDFDVHHGNGTQHIFESDPSVHYMSLHRYPFYPGTGSETETGHGDGLGFTKNYPLPALSGDKSFLDIFNHSLSDAVLRFDPEFLILSSGFDAHKLDPLGGMTVSTEGFGTMSRILVDLARETCQGRLLSVLEGGYSLKGLADSVEVHVDELLKG